MKKNFAVLAACLFLSVKLHAQCTPNAPTGSPGLTPAPANVPCLERGVPFSFTFYFENFNSFNCGIFTADVVSSTIDNVQNLPCGLTWQADRTSYSAGQTGCIYISGTSTDVVGQYPLEVYMTVELDILGSSYTVSGSIADLEQQLQSAGCPGTGINTAYYSRVINTGTACPAIGSLPNQTSSGVSCPPPSSLSVSITGNTTICSGSSTTLTGIASGGSSPYAYQWNMGGPSASITVSPSSTTTYTVTATDNTGSTATASATVTVHANPTVSISNPSAICAGQSVTLTASGGGTYLWNTGATTASITVSPTTTTTYSPTVTNSNGCSATASRTVTVNPIPSVNISGPTSICPGSCATLTASGGVNYAWSTTAVGANITVCPASTTTYTVTITDANACTATGSHTVAVGSAIAVNVAVAICYGDSFFTGGNWQTASGTYCDTFVTATGCDSVVCTNLTVFISSTSNVTISICDGDSVFIAGDYRHSTGIYIDTLVGANGCDSFVTTVLSVDPVPSASFTANVSGNVVTFNSTSTSAFATSYLWNFGDGSTGNLENPTHTYTAQGTYTVSLTAMDSCGSDIITQQVTITGTGLYVIIYPSDENICEGDSVTLTAVAYNDSGMISYSWSIGGFTTQSAVVVSPTSTTTYSVTISDQTSSTATGSTTISVGTAPNTSFTFALVGQTVVLTNTTTGGHSNTWDFGDGTTSSLFTPPAHTYSVNGTYIITLTANNDCGSTSFSDTVVISDILTLTAGSVTVAPGAQAVVTIKVDGFQNIGGAQGSIVFNPQVITLAQVEQFGLPGMTVGDFGLSQAASGILTFLWNDPAASGVSVADGSVIFAIRFNAVGSAGQQSNIDFSNSPTALEFVDALANTVSASFFSGVVEIESAYSVSGYVRSETGQPVRTTSVFLTGQSTQNTTTAVDGSYAFNIFQPGSYTVTPSKSNDVAVSNGISTADILLIRRHVLGNVLLPTPYKIIAADVNASGSISAGDVLLIRALILGDNPTFPNGKLWAFVPSNHVFADVTNPFPYPANLSYPSISTLTNQNFTGMKLGDVNNSWDHNVPKTETYQSVQFVMNEQHVQPGEEITVPVKVKDFTNITGYQFTLSWDAGVLEMLEVRNEKLSGFYGMKKIKEGFLTAQWNNDDTKEVTLSDDEIAFKLKFRAIGNEGSSSELKISSELTSAEAYNENIEAVKVVLTNGFVKINREPSIIHHPSSIVHLSVQPNPFSVSTTIIFTIPKDETVIISIYDLLGKKVWTMQADYEAGKQSIEWTGENNAGETLSKGLYHIRMIAGENSLSEKVILSK